ncbi:MAG: Ig-like domain-containing protein, partial [Gammaproteobacteria bacterium]
GAHTPYQLQASDADGNSLTYIVVSEPKHGALTVNAKTGMTDYVYSSGCHDRFTLKCKVGQADSNVATVTVKSPVETGGGGGLGLELLALIALFAIRRRR